MWFYLISTLENEYRIIAPDSYSLQGTWGLDNVCKAIISIMKAENDDKATFLGISAGGGVAQYFIQEYSDKVEDLILSHCGNIGGLNMKDKLRFPVLLTLIKLLPMSVVRKIMLKQISGNTRVSGEWAEFEKAYYNELAGNLSKETLIRFMKNGIDEKRRFTYKPDRITSWNGRCLILSSKDDNLSFDKVGLLKARFPGSTTHIFEQGGHHTVTFFPEAYKEVIKKFLENTI